MPRQAEISDMPRFVILQRLAKRLILFKTGQAAHAAFGALAKAAGH